MASFIHLCGFGQKKMEYCSNNELALLQINENDPFLKELMLG